MGQSAKRILCRMIFIGMMVALYNLACSSDTYSKEEKERELRINKIISTMCLKFNADTSWINPIRELAKDKQIYTIYLQDLLINKENQPIFFRGSAVDVVEKTEGYYAYFIRDIDFLFSHIQFILKCTKEQAFKIASRPSDSYYHFTDDYAVIAVITHVTKLIYEVNSHQTEYRDEYGHYEFSELVLDIPNNFIATGKCLEVLSLDELEDEIRQE